MSDKNKNPEACRLGKVGGQAVLDGVMMRCGDNVSLSVRCEDGSVKKRIMEQLAVYNSCSGKPYEVSASVGIYISPPGESRDFEELLKKSDELMYMVKSNKKNRRGK